ncbi:4-hydroxy-tetrahydrodipicolinate synthase [bacterium]|uniref:4-hydroxy-tetrahydrodipicolinate synthase n=1 Tax=Candidatus Scatenecus faecavium TaxID=2840915 RepID=A0A9D1K3Y9_9BACT|nr:4-hydroxy-tetrahydrodipicolinate synthase [bacterium]HIS83425.1 4-hydroxy-tetrahydrodipicolinate synthase [Candidatus Scatenecus faecavium]
MALRFDAGEVVTAMVTPMKKSGEIDYNKAEELAKYLIANGSETLLVAGTTGESPTLTHEEELELLSTVKRASANKAKIIMNTGSNSTETAAKMTKLAQKEEVDAVLSVVPYYNKPSQKGMIEHFSAVAEASDLPVILYNIPSRTGVNMLPATVAYLADKYSNIVAIKQSCPDMDLISEMKIQCPADFAIYSGDDSLTLPMMALGVHGVISVASHLFGAELKSMIRNFKTGEVTAAKNMHKTLFPVFRKLFMAPNPVPVKAALAHAGLIEDYVRLPLVQLDDAQKAELFAVVDKVKTELAG